MAAWGLGGIAIGLITFLITDFKTLQNFLAIAFPIGTLANYFIPKYSPRFMYKKGRISDMLNAIVSIADTNSFSSSSHLQGIKTPTVIKNKLGLISYDFDNFTYVLVKKNKNGEKNSFWTSFVNQLKIFSEIFNKENFWVLFAFCIEFTSQFMLYNGTTIAVGSLGFEKIQYSGMLLGATSCLGSLLPLPFLSRMPRKLWSQIFLAAISLVGIMLYMIRAYFYEWEYARVTESFLAAGLVNILVWLLYCINYIHVVESFPIRIRGLAFGLVILSAKILSSFSSYVTDWSAELGYNSLFLCCMLSLVSLPFSLLFKETLDLSEPEAQRGTEKLTTGFFH